MYWKLRVPQKTPDDEICRCEEQPIVLIGNRAYNPIACLHCNGEVEPETIGFPAILAEELSDWLRLYKSVNYLWLDSGHYEDWARNELLNINSPINQKAFVLATRLSHYRTCYFWFFQELESLDFPPFSLCPSCRAPIESIYELVGCRSCRIVFQKII